MLITHPGLAREDVQELAGHSDTRTTRRYDHSCRKVNRNLVEIALSHDGNDFVSSDYGRKQPLKRLLKKFGFHPSLWSRSKVGFSIPDDIVKKRDDGINMHLEELEERNLFKLGVSKQNSARDYIYLNSAIQAFNIWARVWIDSGKVSI